MPPPPNRTSGATSTKSGNFPCAGFFPKSIPFTRTPFCQILNRCDLSPMYPSLEETSFGYMGNSSQWQALILEVSNSLGVDFCIDSTSYFNSAIESLAYWKALVSGQGRRGCGQRLSGLKTYHHHVYSHERAFCSV